MAQVHDIADAYALRAQARSQGYTVSQYRDLGGMHGIGLERLLQAAGEGKMIIPSAMTNKPKMPAIALVGMAYLLSFGTPTASLQNKMPIYLRSDLVRREVEEGNDYDASNQWVLEPLTISRRKIDLRPIIQKQRRLRLVRSESTI